MNLLATPFQQLPLGASPSGARPKDAEGGAGSKPEVRRRLRVLSPSLADLAAWSARASAVLDEASAAEAASLSSMSCVARFAWALGLLTAHVLALLYFVGPECDTTLLLPLLFAAPVALLLALCRGDEEDGCTARGAHAILNTVWFPRYASQICEPRFAPLAQLAAEKAAQRSSGAPARTAVPGSSARRAQVEGERETWEATSCERFSLRGPEYI